MFAMTLYSDFGPRRTRQIVADVIALALIGAWTWLGVAVYQLVGDLAGFGEQMEDAGAGFADTMTAIGTTLGSVPLIGGGIRAPFDGASGAGSALESAGQSQQTTVDQLALVLGVGIAVLPILMILVVWLIPRLRFVRRAAHARSAVRSRVSIDLLALRALASQSVAALLAVDPEPTTAWRRGDAVVMRSLAELELKSAGVRMNGS